MVSRQGPARSRSVAALAVAALALVAPAAAPAAPPENDARSAAATIPQVPGNVTGTTSEATAEADESPQCSSGTVAASVWYRVTSGADRRIVARVAPREDTAVTLAVYREQASGPRFISCDTAENGRAELLFSARAGGRYLLAVMQGEDTRSTAFELALSLPERAPSAPGQRLAASGASGTVDRLSDAADAFSMRLREGVTYRVNLAHPSTRCVELAVFGPGNRSFSGDAAYGKRCGGYLLVTPGSGRSGRWSFVVRARDIERGVTRYRLRVGRARPDDMTPGRALRRRASGRLEGGRLDAMDVYRLDVTERAHVVLRLRTAADNGFDLRLVSSRGRRISCACGDRGSVQVRRALRRGRYYVVVRARNRANGSYEVSALQRTLTATRLTVDGARARPGGTVRIVAAIRPKAAGGDVVFFFERFDPLSGWHFNRTVRLRVRDNRAAYAFRPTEGTWRVRATYRGSGASSPSDSRVRRFRVVAPIGAP